jgi:hypothetical protein
LCWNVPYEIFSTRFSTYKFPFTIENEIHTEGQFFMITPAYLHAAARFYRLCYIFRMAVLHKNYFIVFDRNVIVDAY